MLEMHVKVVLSWFCVQVYEKSQLNQEPDGGEEGGGEGAK
jgi:hypothetical protein